VPAVASNLVQVPESHEVIEQTATHLLSLYVRVCGRGGRRYRRELTDAMVWLSDSPDRALRVAHVLGERLVAPLRELFDLSDPAAGMFFRNVSGEPEEGELVCGAFVNLLLRSDVEAATQVFGEVAGDAQEVRNFLGLLLCLSAGSI
jgi:hypothetical protein